MLLSRRKILRVTAAASLLPGLPAVGQTKRPLRVNQLGFALGIHMPTTAALMDTYPGMGYAPAITRMDQIRTLTQTIIAGAADFGETDPITVMSAAEAHADLKIVGLWYNSTSLVFVVNADKVKDFKDLEKPDVTVAVSGKGDVTHVLLVGPLLQRGIDLDKVTLVEIGGSGARTQALLSGRVDAVPIHFDQAAELAKRGNFKVLLEPWKEYNAWINEIWACRGDWLAKKENERAIIDLLKAEMTAFRKANVDPSWFTQIYHKYATLPDNSKATNESLKPLWTGLVKDVKAWPDKLDLQASWWDDLLAAYKIAGAIQGTVKVEQLLVPDLSKQAVSELES